MQSMQVVRQMIGSSYLARPGGPLVPPIIFPGGRVASTNLPLAGQLRPRRFRGSGV